MAIKQPEILRKLLEKTSNPRTFRGVVEMAVVANQLESIKMLLAAGVCVEDKNCGVFSPLTTAIRERNKEIVRYLLDEAKADPNAPGEHLPLVKKLAWHVHGSMSTAVEVEDLVQVGLVALVEAVAGFEDRGLVTFRQYLATRVRGAMIDELRRHAAMTRGAIRRRRDYNRALSALNTTLGRTPTEREVAGHLGVTLDKLRQDYATAEAVRFEPIDDVYTDDAPWFASGEPDAFDQLAESEQRDVLVAAIAKLPEREALVIQLYHVEELNLEEIGQVLGIGAARVCQIKSAAHARLKKAMLAR